MKNSELGNCTGEISIVSKDIVETKRKIKKSQIYHNIGSKNMLHIFHPFEITKQIPLEQYKKLLSSEGHKKDDDMEMDIIRYYQQSVVVFDDDENITEPQFLVDCDESLIKNMYDVKLAILREYTYNIVATSK